MKVLVAGSSGVIGRQAVALLTEVGHDVVELVRPRSPGRAPGPTSGRTPERVGPDVAVADALDAAAVRDAVGRAEPDAVVDLLTAIPRAINPRRMARDMVLTNRLRTEGLANLVAAAPDARFVVESLAYAYAPTGGVLADEDQPL